MACGLVLIPARKLGWCLQQCKRSVRGDADGTSSLLDSGRVPWVALTNLTVGIILLSVLEMCKFTVLNCANTAFHRVPAQCRMKIFASRAFVTAKFFVFSVSAVFQATWRV
jgi:hypothetical protein